MMTLAISQYTEHPELANIGLEDLVANHRELKAAKSNIEKEYKESSDLIKDCLEGAGVELVMVKDLKLALVSSSNSRIDKKELLARGVAPDVIAESTKVVNYSYLKVSV